MADTPTLLHPLGRSWVFWCSHRNQRSKVKNYESEVHPLVSLATVERFWQVYSHLKRPHALLPVFDYQLFREGIKPVWEDPMNINGGKWMLKLQKGVADRLWESLLLAVVGGQIRLDVCGIVISIRPTEDIISLWNSDASTATVNFQIRDAMKSVLGLPETTVMEYKAHRDALKDRTSFQNADVFR